MHASCSICGDIFTGVHPEVVHSTKCGHIFHHSCLLEWLDRSQSCPHCRSSVSKKSTVRLYFQLSSNPTQDTGTLENKVQSLTFQLTVKDSELKKFSKEVTETRAQNKGLREKLLKAEQNVRNSETVIASLQDNIKILKVQMKSLKEAHLRSEELEAKLEQYKSLEKILKSSAQEAAETLDLMKNVTDTTTLCACINTLKREMQAWKEKTQDLQNTLKSKESKLMSTIRELDVLKEQLSVHKRLVRQMKDEQIILKREVEDLRELNSGSSKGKRPLSTDIKLDFDSKKRNCSYEDQKLFGINISDCNEHAGDKSIKKSNSIQHMWKDSACDSPQSSELSVPSPASPFKWKSSLLKADSKLLLSKSRLQKPKHTSDLLEQCFDGFGGRVHTGLTPFQDDDIFANRTLLQRNKAVKSKLQPSGSGLQNFFQNKH